MKISIQEAAIWLVLSHTTQWMTNDEIGDSCEVSVSRRAVRGYTRRWVNAGMLQVAEVFPAHKYRPAKNAHKHDLCKRLASAAEVFGLKGK